MHVFDDYDCLVTSLREEFQLLQQQGHTTTAFETEFERILSGNHTKRDETIAALDALYEQLENDPGPVRADYPYVEPSDLAGIRASRADGPRTLQTPTGDTLHDRIYGAWLGRIAGCMLGKPVEGWPHDQIKTLGEATGDWPLSDYLPPVDNPPEAIARAFSNPRLLRGTIERGERDDDIDYTILNLKIFEDHGPDLSALNVANAWLANLPFLGVYTAERSAYANLVQRIAPPRSAVVRNPYREWIGAQIRADAWGYLTPGRPEQAAELAFRDASVSHVRNGIYGEMLFAAAISAAPCVRDIRDAIEVGLAEIPQRSRLYEAVRTALDCADRYDTWEEAFAKLRAHVADYHWVHTINNAAYVVLAVASANGDFAAAITRAVMAGADTDCNGATAGSLLGAWLGARALPARWIGPLNDHVDSFVIGHAHNTISELARRTARHAEETVS